jgi:hypothetical protein
MLYFGPLGDKNKEGNSEKPIKCFILSFCDDMTSLALCAKRVLISAVHQHALRIYGSAEDIGPPDHSSFNGGGGGGGGSEQVVFPERAPPNVAHSC